MNPTPRAGGGFDLADADLAKQFNALAAVLKSKYDVVECGVVWCSVCAMYMLVDVCGKVRRMKRRKRNITAIIGRNINNDCLQFISFSLPPLLPFLPISPPAPSPSQSLPSSLSLRPTSPSQFSSSPSPFLLLLRPSLSPSLAPSYPPFLFFLSADEAALAVVLTTPDVLAVPFEKYAANFGKPVINPTYFPVSFLTKIHLH